MTALDSSRRGARLRIVLGAIVAAAMGAWLVRTLGADDVARLWRESRLDLLALSWALYAVTYFFRALRYRGVGVRLDLPRLLALSGVHGFLNRVLPAKSGELAYGILLRRLGVSSFTSAMVGLVEIRLFDLLTVAVFCAVALVLEESSDVARRQAALRLSGATVALTALAYASIPAVLRLSSRVLDRQAARPLRRLAAQLGEIGGDLAAASGSKLVVLSSTTAGAWVFIYLTYACILQGVGITLPAQALIVAASVASLASSLPIAAIGSFGPLEAGWVAGLVWVGVDAATAGAAALAFSTLTLVYAAAFAAFGTWALGADVVAGALSRQAARQMESG